jgi:hypothetical protein
MDLEGIDDFKCVDPQKQGNDFQPVMCAPGAQVTSPAGDAADLRRTLLGSPYADIR